VSLLNAKLPELLFETFRIESPCILSLNLKEFKEKILKNMKKGDVVEVKQLLDSDEVCFLKRRANSPPSKRTEKALEPINEEFPVPQMTFCVHATVSIKSMLNALEEFGEHATFNAHGDNLDLTHTEAYDKRTQIAEFYLGDGMLQELNMIDSDRATSTYYIGYIQEALKRMLKLTEEAIFSYSKDMPLRIKPILERGEVDYYVAPCTGA
jgi:hypothetical protein